MSVPRAPHPTRTLHEAVLLVRAGPRGKASQPRRPRFPVSPPDPAPPDRLQSRLRAVLEHDPIPEVRSEAARALSVAGDGGEEAVDALVAALDDPNDGVRRAATLALGRLRDPRVADALVAALEARPELWQETSAALATAGDPTLLPPLVALLGSEHSHVRRGALRAIAALSHASPPEQPLFVYTDDEGHRHPLF